MDVLLLCGYFEPKYQAEITQKTKTWVENAANTFQQRLIKGLKKQDIHLTVVSAPFIGPWPTAYSDMLFKGFEAGESDEGIEYVGFHNAWGYRNISRTAALKKRVRAFLKKSRSASKAILVYSPHTPFLEAAVYAKKLDPHIHIHMVVPDLPQYMNLSKASHPVYDFFKGIDLKKFYQLNRQVDSYMLLTEHMAKKLQVGDRPYIVVEAIIDEVPKKLGSGHPAGKTIAYAGKLTEAFGVKRLMEAFSMIADPQARLEICGGGELRGYVEAMAREDSRILYHGQVTAEEAQRVMQHADVLVNPRLNDDEYTKYSFPSKNIEYLMTGNRVVAYMLDGMPEVYREFLIVPSDNSIKALAIAFERGFSEKKENDETSSQIAYIQNRLSAMKVAEKMCSVIKCGKGEGTICTQ